MVDFLSTKNADFPQTIGTRVSSLKSKPKIPKKMAHLHWNFLKPLDASNGIHAEKRLWDFLKWLPRIASFFS